MDEVINLPKPTLRERARLACQFFATYLHHDEPTFVIDNGNNHGELEGMDTIATTPEAGDEKVKESSPETGDTPLSSPYAHSNDQSNASGSVPKTSPEAKSPPVANDAKPRALSELENVRFFRPTPINGVVEQSSSGPTKDPRSLWVRVWQRGGAEIHVGRRWRRDVASKIRLSGCFLEREAYLMTHLAVRSEGFHGRDMARFFLALQVQTQQQIEPENLIAVVGYTRESDNETQHCEIHEHQVTEESSVHIGQAGASTHNPPPAAATNSLSYRTRSTPTCTSPPPDPLDPERLIRLCLPGGSLRL